MAAASLAWLAGIGLQMQQPALWPAAHYLALALGLASLVLALAWAVLAQRTQRTQDAVVAVPVAGGLADATVDHEIVGPLGDLGVEVVHQHAQWRFGEPAARAQGRAARGADVVMRVLHEARIRGASQR